MPLKKKKKAHAKTARAAQGKKTPLQTSPSLCFWVHYGPILGNIYDLDKALQTISEEQFAYHVNKEKNDFARWSEDILHESALAEKLSRTKTRKTACKIVSAYIKNYY